MPLIPAHPQDVRNGEPPILRKVCIGRRLQATLAANPLYPLIDPAGLRGFMCRRDVLFQAMDTSPDGSHLKASTRALCLGAFPGPYGKQYLS